MPLRPYATNPVAGSALLSRWQTNPKWPARPVPVFHVMEYGAVVISLPSGSPSTRNWTPATGCCRRTLLQKV